MIEDIYKENLYRENDERGLLTQRPGLLRIPTQSELDLYKQGGLTLRLG